MIVHKTPLRIAIFSLGYVALIVMAALMVVPFEWMVVTSLKPSGTEFAYPPELWPKRVDWSNYTRIFTLVPFALYFVNTIFVTTCIVVGQLIIGSLAAYSFARLHFIGRDVIFLLYLATMMIPFQIILIPLYLMVFRFGWINTYWGLIIPGLSSAFGIFLLRQSFLGIPRELQDAARMDGASEWRIYWQVMLPLVGPALATLGVFAFMGSWTDLIWPLLIARDKELRTLELGLAYFNASTSAFKQPNWPLVMAASVTVMLPVLIVYIFTQRYFVAGISLSGLKG